MLNFMTLLEYQVVRRVGVGGGGVAYSKREKQNLFQKLMQRA